MNDAPATPLAWVFIEPTPECATQLLNLGATIQAGPPLNHQPSFTYNPATGTFTTSEENAPDVRIVFPTPDGPIVASMGDLIIIDGDEPTVYDRGRRRRTDACPGRCNSRYRDAWDTHDATVVRWQNLVLLQATTAVEQRSEVPEDASTQALARSTPERPETPEVTGALGDPVWCSRCRSNIRRALTEVDRLAALLDSWADGHRGAQSGEKISRRASEAGTPSPIALTLDTLYGEVTDLEDEWRQFRGYVALYRGRARGAHSRSMAIAFILEHLADILSQREHVPFGHRVLAWERLLCAQTKTDPVVRKRPGRCPRPAPVCGMVNTLQTRDDGYTECSNCGRLMDEEEYQRDVLGKADVSVIVESQQDRQVAS